MRRLRTRTRYWRRLIARRIAGWDEVFGLDSEDRFFAGWEEMSACRFGSGGFSPSDSWWFAELCRTAYTPDRRELARGRGPLLARRENFLPTRSPFVELLSIHKTGNHLSVYRRADGGGGTVVCFRGTNRVRQWMVNMLIRPHGWSRFRLDDDPADAFLHSGFYLLFKRIGPLLLPELEELPRPWVFTGHSLGGALATICGAVAAADLVCTFGAPKIGNAAFHQIPRMPATWRFVNGDDIVPRLPLPDARMGRRVLTHGTAALRLLEDRTIGAFSEPAAEDRLPFDPRRLANELPSPPAWLRDHRIGGYCARLRSIAAGS